MRGRKPLNERFDILAPTLRPPNKCWVWLGCLNNTGYGSLFRGGSKSKKELAHRISWEIHRGPIPAGLCVLHKCDNRSCVNPSHLFLGTRRDNTHDMIAKGRNKFDGLRLGSLVPINGENNPNAKLTADDVAQIRRMLMQGGITQRQIAKDFGVSENQIKEIKYGRRWASLTRGD